MIRSGRPPKTPKNLDVYPSGRVVHFPRGERWTRVTYGTPAEARECVLRLEEAMKMNSTDCGRRMTKPRVERENGQSWNEARPKP